MAENKASFWAGPLTKTYLNVFALVVAAFLVAGVSFNSGSNSGRKREARSAAFREYHAKRRSAVDLGKAVSLAVRIACRKHISREEFEEVLGPLRPVDPIKHPEAQPDDTHVYFHPESQRTFYLRFTQDGLMGCHSSHGTADIKIPLPEILKKQI
jgi:hypothetical protein